MEQKRSGPMAARNGDGKGFNFLVLSAAIGWGAAVLAPLYTWTQGTSNRAERLRDDMEAFERRQNDINIAQARENGRRDQLLADRGEVDAAIKNDVHDILTRQIDNQHKIDDTMERVRALERAEFHDK